MAVFLILPVPNGQTELADAAPESQTVALTRLIAPVETVDAEMRFGLKPVKCAALRYRPVMPRVRKLSREISELAWLAPPPDPLA